MTYLVAFVHKLGQNIAIYYDEDFHIGSVSSISSPDLTEVNFLKKCVVANKLNNTYVWQSKTRQNKSVEPVFDYNFDIVTTTGSPFTWGTEFEVLCVHAKYS